MMSTEPGGFVESSDDTLVHFIDLDLHAEAAARGERPVPIIGHLAPPHALAGEGHFTNVQVPEKVNPLLANALGIPKTLSRSGKRP